MHWIFKTNLKSLGLINYLSENVWQREGNWFFVMAQKWALEGVAQREIQRHHEQVTAALQQDHSVP